MDAFRPTLFLLSQLSELDAFYFALFGDNILATQVTNQYPTKQLIDAGPTSTPNLSMDDIRGLLPSNTNWSTLRARTTKELVNPLTKTSLDLKTWYDDTVDKVLINSKRMRIKVWLITSSTCSFRRFFILIHCFPKGNRLQIHETHKARKDTVEDIWSARLRLRAHNP